MRFFRVLVVFAAAGFGFQVSAFQGPPAVQEFSHLSQVMRGTRTYRVFFPPAYAKSQKRYPVLYWFHGYESSDEVEAYSQTISAYLTTHDLLVVDTGPVETTGEFPQYFPELADQVDRTLRTVADREHRALSGYSAGGFMAFFLAAKYPDLVGSASSFIGPIEYSVGPKDFDVEFNAADFYANYDGVRTRLVTGTRDFVQFYHRILNAEWMYAKGNHQTEDFDSEHGTPGLAKTLDFHMRAFADPLPKPVRFTHADPYPNFDVWGWEVSSDRRQPGYTMLENASADGFRSSVREWAPGGAFIPRVKVTIATPRSYAPASAHPVTILRLRDGKLEPRTLKADERGRLNIDLDGDAYEVGIGPEAQIAAPGYSLQDASWVTEGQAAHLRVRFCNKGAVRSTTQAIRWESSDPGVKFDAAGSRLFGLAPGEMAALNVNITVASPARPVVRIFAIAGAARMPLDVPVFPAAGPGEFRISDGKTFPVFQHGTQKSDLTLGEGNGDGNAAPGETFALLVPDGDGMRAAELFSGDSCLDLAVRASDSWVTYDHTGASAKYTLASIPKDCAPGTRVKMIARVVYPNAPNHTVRYFAIEIPVWYRNP